MGNSSVLGAGRDVPRSWAELTPIEPTQQLGFLHTPRGSAIKKQGGRLSRTVCSRAAESLFGFRGVGYGGVGQLPFW